VGDWKRIGCALDFSDGSLAALREAIELSRRFGAALVLLHAEEMLGVTDIPPPASVVESTRRELAARLAELAGVSERELGRSVERHLFPGPAAPAIAQAAAEQRLDLLVTGTHGRRGFRHLVLGSVAERLVHLAPCAVLVIRS
jgi:nucleotide-binding universal stress UspA family protein